MRGLIHAELIKLRSTRMTAWLALTATALVVLLVLVTVPTGNGSDSTLSLGDRDLWARVVAVGAGGGWIIVLVLGVIAFTQELRFGTVTPTFLATPRRERILVAKVLALSLVGLLFAAVTMTLDVCISAVFIGARHGTLVWSGQLSAVLAAVILVFAVAGPIGVAVGTIVRDQVAAVVGTLVWLLVAEQLLVFARPRSRPLDAWRRGRRASPARQLGDDPRGSPARLGRHARVRSLRGHLRPASADPDTQARRHVGDSGPRMLA